MKQLPVAQRGAYMRAMKEARAIKPTIHAYAASGFKGLTPVSDPVFRPDDDGEITMRFTVGNERRTAVLITFGVQDLLNMLTQINEEGS